MIGKTITHFNILEKLGEGGMGIVYKARDSHLDRLVAIKFLPPFLTADEQITEQFIHEARAASALDHANICTIYEFDKTENNQLFMVMAYYTGKTLKQIIADAEEQDHAFMPVDKCIKIVIQTARGLAKAHEEGIIHRDIKPANIMITNDNQVKILDFGLAELKGELNKSDGSSTSGTIGYMSPEQSINSSVDQRTDIWSLGVVTYEMLIRELPFPAAYDQSVVYAILKKGPAPLSSIRSDVPKRLEQIVYKCLQKEQEQRYQNTGEIIKELTSLPGVGIKSAKAEKQSSKKWFYVYTIVSVFLLLIIMGLYLFYPAASIDDKKTVLAVLPFENLSADPENEYFSDGITEDLRAQLSKISNFKVLSRTSVLQYKEAPMNLGEIAENLNAGAVLEGSVRRSEGRVRIVTQLFDTKTEERLWTEIYDTSFTNIFDIQIDIAGKIAAALETELTSVEKAHIKRKPTANISAYDYYLKGIEYYNRGMRQNNEYAIKFFKKALELDSDYAPAYAGLSDSYIKRTVYSELGSAWYDSAMTMTEKAIAIDPNCSEAYSSLGYLLVKFIAYPKALEAYNKAIELKPSSSRTLYRMGELKRMTGMYEEALNYYKKAAELNPMSAAVFNLTGKTYTDLGDYDSAEQQFHKSLDIEPDQTVAIYGLALLYLQQDKYDQAIQYYKDILQLDPVSLWQTYHFIAVAYKNQGNFDEAIINFEKALQVKPNSYHNYKGIASVYVEQARYDDAIAIYKKFGASVPHDMLTTLHHSFVLARIGKIKKARSILEPILNNPSSFTTGVLADYTYDIDISNVQLVQLYLQFYMGEIDAGEIKNTIRQVLVKAEQKSYQTEAYYYLGMGYLLNLNREFRDSKKAIEYLSKYISQVKKNNYEYSLARAELRQLGVIE